MTKGFFMIKLGNGLAFGTVYGLGYLYEGTKE
jgi:hypothetical protein